MFIRTLLASLFFLGFSAAACAEGIVPTVSRDPQFDAAVAAIQVEHYDEAIKLLDAYVLRVPNDADAWNWLGFSSRKSGKLAQAFTYYEKALAINPKHRGVHEYMGEAYLTANNLAKAEEHLKFLSEDCILPCQQYTKLKNAIAEYKAKR
ncbi:MAG: tetratricopeptide repeat protein [Pseudomonadota bacterium]